MSPELQGLVEQSTLNQQIEALGKAADSGFTIDPLVILDNMVNEKPETVTTEKILADMSVFWN